MYWNHLKCIALSRMNILYMHIHVVKALHIEQQLMHLFLSTEKKRADDDLEKKLKKKIQQKVISAGIWLQRCYRGCIKQAKDENFMN